MSKISLSVCLIFVAAACAEAGDKADAARQAAQAAAVGKAALNNSGNPEKSMSLNRSWTTGEKLDRPGLAILTAPDSPAFLRSLQSGKPGDLSGDPSLAPAPSAEIIPMPALTDPKEDLIARMIESDHALSDKERFVLMKTLGEYRLEALQSLYDSGFRVMVTDNYKDFPSSKYDVASAYYRGGAKPKVVMRKDYLEGGLWPRIRTGLKDLASILAYHEEPWGGSRETLIHEMAHAWDDHQAKGNAWKNFRIKGGEDSAPKVRELYDNFQAAIKKDPDKRWSFYAADAVADPGEYVAEGYRMLGQSGKTRKILAEKDPELYAWMKSRAAVLYEAEIP